MIGTFYAIEVAGDEFLGEEVRHFCVLRFCMIVNAERACYHEASILVELMFPSMQMIPTPISRAFSKA